MSTTTYSDALLPLAGTDQTVGATSTKPGFFARFMAALIKSREAHANRVIARMEARYGYSLTEGSNSDARLSRDELPF